MMTRITYVVHAKGDPPSSIVVLLHYCHHIFCAFWYSESLINRACSLFPQKAVVGGPCSSQRAEEGATLGCLRRSWKCMYDWWMYVVVFRAVSAGTERKKGNVRDPSDK